MKRRVFLTSFVFSLFLILNVVTAQESGLGSITGTIVAKGGKSMSGGRVSFFHVAIGPLPFTLEYVRFPDYSAIVTGDGSFSAQLPEGTYYLMAVKKLAREKPGIPEEGDFIYPPLEGKVQKPYSVKAGETTDIGVISEAVPLKKEWAIKAKTGIEGFVLGMNGEPFEGALVLASDDAAMDKTLFVSDGRTDKKGEYIVRVPKGGQYYVRVKGQREVIVAATVKSGEITTGINVPLKSIPGSQVPSAYVSKKASGPCQAEDFETRVTGVSECLVMRRYGFTGPSSPRTMLVWLHGDLSEGDPANYHFPLAEKAAAEFAEDKVLSVALVRPGYSDGSGNTSSGNNYGCLDSYTAENIAEVGGAIGRLRLRYKPDRVIMVGDSGGAAIAAVLLGMKPNLAEGAVLVACPCELVSWRGSGRPWIHSENPIRWTEKVGPRVKVIALTGAKDSNTFSELAQSFVEALRVRSIDASFQMVPDGTHGSVIRSAAVSEAIAGLVRW